ncbi:MAG TPA: PLP-dependent aminotransferase family protein, partial [Longimicrobium sp.]|nr:PLP-dependent aminotransferase family protein [Longimicrobium sp.]
MYSDTLHDDFALAGWLRTVRQSALREIHAVIARPGILSFALGMPATDLFPAADYARAQARALEDPRAMQYGLPHRGLTRHVVELMARRGVTCREEQVFLTNGAQHGMSLMGRLLVDPGATVITEELCYDGIHTALRPQRPRILTVPTGPDGIDVDAVERRLEAGERPAFVYTITDGHNPLGVSLSPAKRARLVELAQTYRVPILEDDAYGFLSLDGEAPPPMRALDERWVYYIGSFAKVLAPALRVAWLVVPEPLVPLLSATRQGNDLDVSTLAQHAVSAWLDDGRFPAHLARLRGEYTLRRDAMLRALGEHFPAEARWRRPGAGLFVWVELPREVDA